MTLNELSIGARARIVDVTGDDAIAVRLMEMGLTEGEPIEFLGKAPLGDPLEFLIRGYRISLRHGEASRVIVEPLPTTC
jgi:ferrous iron transport protein A